MRTVMHLNDKSTERLIDRIHTCRLYVIIWGWEWRQDYPTSTIARQATHLWTWGRSTRAFSGRKTSSHSSSKLFFQKIAPLSKSATLSWPNKSRTSSAKLILTSTSWPMPWWLGLKLGMISTQLELQLSCPMEKRNRLVKSPSSCNYRCCLSLNNLWFFGFWMYFLFFNLLFYISCRNNKIWWFRF